jgi:hypothetical protein
VQRDPQTLCTTRSQNVSTYLDKKTRQFVGMPMHMPSCTRQQSIVHATAQCIMYYIQYVLYVGLFGIAKKYVKNTYYYYGCCFYMSETLVLHKQHNIVPFRPFPNYCAYLIDAECSRCGAGSQQLESHLKMLGVKGLSTQRHPFLLQSVFFGHFNTVCVIRAYDMYSTYYFTAKSMY